MVKANFAQYDATASNNEDVGGVDVSPDAVISSGDDAIRELMSHIKEHFSEGTIASAATCDIGAENEFMLNVTGTTGITAFGTIDAGTWKLLVFAGAVTVTHNAASLILPGGSDITTAAGDMMLVISEGSGNWRCILYTDASAGTPLYAGNNLSDVGTAATAFNNIKQAATTSATGVVELATAAEYQANTSGKTLETDKVWSAMAETALTSSSNAVAWDMSSGIDFKIDPLAENTTIGAPTNVTVGKKGRLRIVQDSGGGNTVAWNAVFEFAGGSAPTATTDADAEDLFYYDAITSSRILISPILDIS